MVRVTTYVFFDIETTGLPFQERNKTKITELCFLAVSRDDLDTQSGLPPIKKLSFVLNPEKRIHPDVVVLTGLTNESLKNAPTFKQRANAIVSFLNELPKPICLVAHNGNSFDYKILLAECNDAGILLPSDLLCIDSLIGFRKILKTTQKSLPLKMNTSKDDSASELLWPELDVSTENWEEIDNLCASFSKDTCIDDEKSKKENDLNEQKCTNLKKARKNKNDLTTQDLSLSIQNKTTKKREFTLTGLYKRLLDKDAVNAHRAEDDCVILIECVLALRDEFLAWADESCKTIHQIKPLIRY